MKLKLYRILWYPTRSEYRDALILDYDEEKALARLIKTRGCFYQKYEIVSIDEIKLKPRFLGEYFG